MQEPAYDQHREVWLNWLNANTDATLTSAEVHFERVLNKPLLPGSIAERQIVIDSISEEGYHALLIGTYRDDTLASVVLDSDEGHVEVLHAEASE